MPDEKCDCKWGAKDVVLIITTLSSLGVTTCTKDKVDTVREYQAINGAKIDTAAVEAEAAKRAAEAAKTEAATQAKVTGKIAEDVKQTKVVVDAWK